MKAVKGKYHNGVVDILEKPLLDEETDVLVIFPDNGDEKIWLKMKEKSLTQFWEEPELDIYNKL